MSPSPVVVTKLFVPTSRAAIVVRPRLLQQLEPSAPRDVTLLCAPAGFGKTTLLSAWVAGSGRATAWVSLEEADSDLGHFLSYLIASLQTVAPGIGSRWLEAVGSSSPPAAEAVLASLVNEISQLPDALTLVLDDYHLIDSVDVDTALTFLVQHLPRQLHLVISSRQDPNLPLARLRARDQLTELRAADLRFTPEEAADFLTSVMGLNLSGDDISSLEQRTEGWIAGLQLAALSIRQHKDTSAFIRNFAGDHRFIADYLVGEVLERQPDDVRAFLLQTSVLDQMSGSLCDAVTGQSGSQARLDALERGNFFLVPLDDQRRWYRYHHLFGEVLRAYLSDEQLADVALLHRRASSWYEQRSDLPEAVRHGLAAGDVERVADLLEQSAQELLRKRQEGALLGWLRALPPEVFANRPVLTATYAGVLLASGLTDGVEAHLDAAERWLGPLESNPGRVVVDEGTFRQLPGAIAMWRAGAALLQGDIAGTVAHAHLARQVAAPDDHLTRGGAAGLLGLTALGSGDLEDAYAKYTECIGHLRQEDHVADILGCTITLADIRIVQGRLGQARDLYEEGLRLATPANGQWLRGIADMHVGLAEIHYERDELDAAIQQLAKCDALGEGMGLPQNAYRSRVARAHLLHAGGDGDAAAELLAQAEILYDSDFSPKLRPVPAMRARLAVTQGRLGDALAWTSTCDLSVDDEVTYLREFEFLTLARVLIAEHQGGAPEGLGQVANLLARLLEAAESGGRTRSVIEVLVMQALTLRTSRHTDESMKPLTRALLLAESDMFVRTFMDLGTDPGSTIKVLLKAAAQAGTGAHYAQRLLALASREGSQEGIWTALPDPLSQRELDVLRLLATDLTGPAIARHLVVSLHTVRSHTKSIYRKLGVNSRQAAVRRSGKLGLLLTGASVRPPVPSPRQH